MFVRNPTGQIGPPDFEDLTEHGRHQSWDRWLRFCCATDIDRDDIPLSHIPRIVTLWADAECECGHSVDRDYVTDVAIADRIDKINRADMLDGEDHLEFVAHISGLSAAGSLDAVRRIAASEKDIFC